MKKAVALSLLIIGMVSFSDSRAAQSQKHLVKPHIENMVATSAIITGTPMVKGKAYALNTRPYLTVSQNTGNGLLLVINSGLGLFANTPDTFFLHTNSQLVDKSLLPVPTCGVYEGLIQYTDVVGAIRTIHSFREVSCGNYVFPPAKQTAKTTSSSTTTSPASDTKAENPPPYDEWVTIDSKTNLRVKRIRPGENPIDFSRWAQVYTDGKMKLFIDKATIAKTISPNRSGPNNTHDVSFKFWLEGLLADKTYTTLSSPMQSEISCQSKTFDNEPIVPESMHEAVYRYLCLSQDAVTASYNMTPEETAAKTASETYNKSQQSAQSSIVGTGLLWSGMSLINMFRR